MEIFNDDLDVLELVENGFPRRIYNRANYFEDMDALTFFKRFRLTKPTVISILQEIEEQLEFDHDRNHSVTPINQLLTTLRFYATGAHLSSVGDFMGIHESTASRIVQKVSLILSRLRPTYIKMPQGQEIIETQNQFFQVASFPRVIGCLDCTHIRIISPGGDDAEVFRNRKGYFSVNVQAVCDNNLKFSNIVARWPGSAHDSTIFNNSRLRASFENNDFQNSVILGNQIYAAEVEFPQNLDPFEQESNSNSTLSEISESNNSVLSHEKNSKRSVTLKGSETCTETNSVPSISQVSIMGEVSDSQLDMSEMQEKSGIEIEIRTKSDIKNHKPQIKNDHSLRAETLHYQKLLSEYEKTISNQCTELEKLKQEHETTSRHFATLELAFSDVLQKYDRSKIIVDGFKSNEEALTQNLQIAEEKLKQNEAKYESLKTYAKSQIEKCNVEILNVRDKYEFESSKLRALIKRLEIKCSSLETSLNQKTEECEQLSALCDDITGKQV